MFIFSIDYKKIECTDLAHRFLTIVHINRTSVRERWENGGAVEQQLLLCCDPRSLLIQDKFFNCN